MIIAHQRLRNAPVPINDDLSSFHRQLRHTADHVLSATSDDKRRRYFTQLLEELDIYRGEAAVLGRAAAGDRAGWASGVYAASISKRTNQ